MAIEPGVDGGGGFESGDGNEDEGLSPVVEGDSTKILSSQLVHQFQSNHIYLTPPLWRAE